tara:strand:- start:637 stop:867 length:231 start_codon:yes stop_codon:yes gene_type:complete
MSRTQRKYPLGCLIEYDNKFGKGGMGIVIGYAEFSGLLSNVKALKILTTGPSIELINPSHGKVISKFYSKYRGEKQ